MPGRCASTLTRRLAEHGGWMGRTQLAHGLDFGAGVVDDELADLVVAGTVLFNDRTREYRLGGTLWARRAMRDLVRDKLQRAVVGGPSTDRKQYHLGMAQRRALADGSEQLVMHELVMDNPRDMAGMDLLTKTVAGWLP